MTAPASSANQAGFGALQWTDAGVPNGQTVCYRIRTVVPSGASSAWSAAECVVPRSDASPPGLELVEASIAALSTEANIKIRFDDHPHDHHEFVEGLCPSEGVESGVGEMRVALHPSFPGAAWRPAREKFSQTAPEGTVTIEWDAANAVLTVRYPNFFDDFVVYVQVRDRAGNESRVLRVPIERPLKLPVSEVLDAGAGVVNGTLGGVP